VLVNENRIQARGKTGRIRRRIAGDDDEAPRVADRDDNAFGERPIMDLSLEVVGPGVCCPERVGGNHRFARAASASAQILRRVPRPRS
jgi:hypothetical protein